MLIDAAQQGSAFGVQLPQPGVLAPQLLGFFLDLLGFALDLLAVAPHAQDFTLELLHPPFALHLALLVAGIASPIEHR